MRSIAVVGAPSSIGIRPYDDGTVRQLHRAPQVLRELGLIGRLGAVDHGDIIPPKYLDISRPGMRPRNEAGVVRYSHALAQAVADAATDGAFVLVLGGDCSILLGCLLGARALDDPRIGLVYIDAHADFATPEESVTGSVAAMAPSFAVGRGDSPLARLAGEVPLVSGRDCVLIGRRDEAEGDIYGQAALRASEILDIPDAAAKERGPADTARLTLERLARMGVRRFWIHVDADVLDPSVLPAVDSPTPNGMSLDDLIQLLVPLVNDPGAVGLELTIYDPKLDPDRSSAKALVSLLERSLVDGRSS